MTSHWQNTLESLLKYPGYAVSQTVVESIEQGRTSVYSGYILDTTGACSLPQFPNNLDLPVGYSGQHEGAQIVPELVYRNRHNGHASN